MTDNTEIYEFEGFSLNAKKQRLYRNGEIISLPPKAIELLVFMVENQGRVLEKEEILNTLWQDTFVEEANLTQTIYLLRKALGKSKDGVPLITTLPKRGYKFIPPVQKVSDDKISVTIERTKKEQIFIQREETEKITATVSKPVLANQNRSFTSNKQYLLASLTILFLLGIGAFFFWRKNNSSVSGLQNIRSITVAPFNLIGGDDKNGYLSLGLADTIVNRLGNSNKIKIRSAGLQRVSNPLELGKSLNSDAVLTGNIQQVETRVRFNAQLLNVNDGEVLWTQQFDEDASNLFVLQDSITRQLSDALTLQLTGEEQKLLVRNPTENLDALKLYWQGRFYWNRRTPEWIRKGIECFEAAIKLDPNFAQAYAGLADSYVINASGFSVDERFTKAKQAALRALELNENLAEAHTSLAMVLYKFDWDWKNAEMHFRRAIELNPSYPTAHHWYGENLGIAGRFEEALNELKQAESLDPFSLAVKIDTAATLYRAGRYDEALDKAKKVLEIESDYIQAYRIIRHIYIKQNIPNEIIK
ncbi:MAG TPA: winged helix-turn-helix domain-containing protein, partial [Pyrinomonadaceae bacterium]|nr:winged helix-turn-helix domain-containing protein [Pyrinomonadaceae bacterium]